VIDNILQPTNSLVSMLKIDLVAGLLWVNQRNGLHSSPATRSSEHDVRERCTAESEMHVLLDGGIYIRGQPTQTLVRQGGGHTVRGSTLGETLIAYKCHHRGPIMGWATPHIGGGPGPMYL
jgi:hypothetical protein